MSHHHQHTTLTEGLVLWQLGKIARALEEKKPPKQPTPAELGLYKYNFTPEQRAIFEGTLAGTLRWEPAKKAAFWKRVLCLFGFYPTSEIAVRPAGWRQVAAPHRR